MKIRQMIWQFATIGILMCAITRCSHGANIGDSSSLAGAKGVYIVVNDLNQDAINGGLDSDKIKSEIIHRLTNEHIEVSDHQGGVKIITLNIIISTNKIGYVYVFTLETDVIDFVKPVERPTVMADAIIWSKGEFGTVGDGQLIDLAASVDSEVDQFIADYKKVNPKHAK